MLIDFRIYPKIYEHTFFLVDFLIIETLPNIINVNIDASVKRCNFGVVKKVVFKGS